MSKQNWLLINVLPDDFYNDCHIDQSINVPLEKLADYVNDLDKSQEIILYCASYNCSKSNQAWRILDNLGFMNVRAYEGGMQEWHHHGFIARGACSLSYLHAPLKEPYQKKNADKVQTISIIQLKEKLDQRLPLQHIQKKILKKQRCSGSTVILSYIKLVSLIAGILLLALVKNYNNLYNYSAIMVDFMGFYFLCFGSIQFFSLEKFVRMFRNYDLIASLWISYAYLYPMIEIFLGIAYISNWHLKSINWFACIFMLISSIGIARALMSKAHVECACMGSAITLPISYISLLETIGMGFMALYMNLNHLY